MVPQIIQFRFLALILSTADNSMRNLAWMRGLPPYRNRVMMFQPLACQICLSIQITG
jgi:hypothetical protein